MQITINITTDTRGIEQIIANCDNVTPKIIEDYGGKTASAAKIFSPVDTGALMSSIDSTMISLLTARIQAHVEYDIYQELGTYKMAAHPFLAPAAELIAKEFLMPTTWRPLLP